MSEINPTDHKSITAADTTQLPTFREIISGLRLTFRSRESMDLGNAIIVYIMFGHSLFRVPGSGKYEELH